MSGSFPFTQRCGVVILAAMYPRTVKICSSNGTINEYVRVVEAFRENGKVKQRVVADLGRKDLLVQMLPKLKRLLAGDDALDTGDLPESDVLDASTWGPVLAVRTLFDQLGLWKILDESLGRSKDVPFADRAFVLVANRLIRPSSEHRIAGWLETDFVCDRKGMGLITKREPFSIIWGAPPLASFSLSSSPRIAQELSCSLSCSFRSRGASRPDETM